MKESEFHKICGPLHDYGFYLTKSRGRHNPEYKLEKTMYLVWYPESRGYALLYLANNLRGTLRYRGLMLRANDADQLTKMVNDLTFRLEAIQHASIA